MGSPGRARGGRVAGVGGAVEEHDRDGDAHGPGHAKIMRLDRAQRVEALTSPRSSRSKKPSMSPQSASGSAIPSMVHGTRPCPARREGPSRREKMTDVATYPDSTKTSLEELLRARARERWPRIASL